MFLLLIFALCCVNYAVANNGTAVQSNTPPQQMPIHLTINNYQNNDTKQTQANANTNQSTQANSNSNSTSFTNQIKQSMLKFLNFAKKEVPRHQEMALGFFRQHKQMVLLGLVGCTYGLLFAYLFTLNTFLADNEKWHGWKNEHSLEDLALGNSSELAHTLLITIQQKYFNPRDPANNQKPLVRFYNDILVEMNKIDRYLQIGTVIHNFQLSYFFPVTKKRLKKAQQKRRKLEFMQRLLITHMATQNSFPITKSYQFDMFLKKAIMSRQMDNMAQMEPIA